MWLEASLLLAAFLAAVALILLQDYIVGRRKRKAEVIPGERPIETGRSSDQVFRRIEEAISEKGKLTVDELSDIILSESSSLELHGESLRARLQEMDTRIAAVLDEMKKGGLPGAKETPSSE